MVVPSLLLIIFFYHLFETRGRLCVSLPFFHVSAVVTRNVSKNWLCSLDDCFLFVVPVLWRTHSCFAVTHTGRLDEHSSLKYSWHVLKSYRRLF